MRKIFSKLLVLLVAVASTMGLTGCGPDNAQNIEPLDEQNLIGKWKLVAKVAEINVGGKVETNNEMPSIVQTLEFKSDGTLITTEGENDEMDTHTGTYVFKNNKIIITIPEEQVSSTIEVKELTSKKLVLVMVETEEQDGVKATVTITDTYEKMNGSGGQDPEEQEGPMQVYTVFDAASGIMTYYCDGKINSRNGDYKEIYDPSKDLNELRPDVSKYYEKVKKAVIDPSMKDYPYASMTNLFGSCYSDEDQKWHGLENMTEIVGLENLSTANVTDMSFMFSKCASLHTVDLGSFITANVTNMQGMFSDCGSLDSVNLSSFNTANVTDMEGMFYYCSSLKSLDLCAFNTSKLEDTKQMFAYCSSLETIYCNDDWSKSTILTSSVAMFEACDALEGGKGTKFDFQSADKTYARPDGGSANPGYFTVYRELVTNAFSVSKGTQVLFSKANLQYHPTNEVWRFADAEYDIVGNDNSKIARFCENWIDLFGWGSADEPYNASTYISEYPSDFTDWGTKNISNGGGRAWRTLTAAEWEYLLVKRPNAASLFGFGCVNGTNGLILLPDGWEMVKPENLTFVPAAENGFENKGSYYQSPGDNYGSNTYTLSQWAAMEEAWAVFLPAAGSRFSKNVSEVNQKGYYWSATHAEEDGKAHYIYFRSNGYSVSGATSVSCGYSVRLVRDVE